MSIRDDVKWWASNRTAPPTAAEAAQFLDDTVRRCAPALDRDGRVALIEAVFAAYGDTHAQADRKAGAESLERTHPALRAFGESLAAAVSREVLARLATADDVFDRLIAAGNNGIYAHHEAMKAVKR